jgi:hypothetical protein
MKTYDHTFIIAEWERMGRPEVEFLNYKDEWQSCEDDPLWLDEMLYRIKSKPRINWEHVHESVTAMATDEDTETYLYLDIDTTPANDYEWDGSYAGRADIFQSFTQGTCDWRDSLVMRPVVIGE